MTRQKKIVIAIIAGVVIIFGCCLTAGFSWFRTLMAGKNETTAAIDEFLGYLEQEDYDAAWAMVAPEWKQIGTKDDLHDVDLMIDEVMGDLKSKSTRNLHISTKLGNKKAELVFNAIFENGNGTMEFLLLDHGNGWEIAGYHVNSPVFATRMKDALMREVEADDKTTTPGGASSTGTE